MSNAFFAIVQKELSSVIRDRTILIAIAIQLFIASFSSALLIGLLSLYDPESIGEFRKLNVSVALVNMPGDPLAEFINQRGLQAYDYPSLDDAAAAFAQRKVSAILITTAREGNTLRMRLYLPRSQARSSLILMVLQDPLKRYENFLRQRSGITVRFTDLQGEPPTTFEFIYSVIIPILMFFPASIAGGMVVDSISEEIENKTLETLLSAPLSLNMIVSAKITAAVFLTAVQCLAWLGMLRLNAIVVHNQPLVLLLATIIAGIISVGSAFVAVIFKDRERSQFVYSLFILAATSASYLLDLSPIQILSRLAVGDAYTHAGHVLIFGVLLAALLVFFFRITRRFAA